MKQIRVEFQIAVLMFLVSAVSSIFMDATPVTLSMGFVFLTLGIGHECKAHGDARKQSQSEG